MNFGAVDGVVAEAGSLLECILITTSAALLSLLAGLFVVEI